MQEFYDSHDIHDIRPPVPVGMDPLVMRVALILLILLLLACAGFFLYRCLKRRKAGNSADLPLLPLPLPPNEAALKALDSLGDLMLGAPRLYYFRLTEIVKRFIGRQFDLGAPEMTTQELVFSIRDLGIDKGLLADTREFLLFSDTIKYAGEDPSPSMMQGHGAFVRKFIVAVASASNGTGQQEGGSNV
ncbi:MAG: hypothetical protein GY737_00680 [Desulfobacteraceae bacterium]|nr:hypothetical protein [Desulfobacteraceae bacterium]